jgi:hypothetical protein
VVGGCGDCGVIYELPHMQPGRYIQEDVRCSCTSSTCAPLAAHVSGTCEAFIAGGSDVDAEARQGADKGS